jgi:hypothetical protein
MLIYLNASILRLHLGWHRRIFVILIFFILVVALWLLWLFLTSFIFDRFLLLHLLLLLHEISDFELHLAHSAAHILPFRPGPCVYKLKKVSFHHPISLLPQEVEKIDDVIGSSFLKD